MVFETTPAAIVAEVIDLLVIFTLSAIANKNIQQRKKLLDRFWLYILFNLSTGCVLFLIHLFSYLSFFSFSFLLFWRSLFFVSSGISSFTLSCFLVFPWRSTSTIYPSIIFNQRFHNSLFHAHFHIFVNISSIGSYATILTYIKYK